ncbi:platelet binding protein GspB-like [Argopecten irradians]|uniref:platelet binding protein GspB-like n=1 Tax=Argopecten irradians TaxID=31199 RepID=UPI00371EEF73
MLRRRPSVKVYVRNKARYNPSTEGKDFVCVDITDFAGTTIGDIKEEVRRKCRNTLKIDDLFLDNKALDDDRSVAHFNLEDGTILETTSNPFWVTCINIKHIEVEREQKANPNDKHTQNWTRKSIIRKRTLLSVLLNSKGEYLSQPPHFPALDDFTAYLEVLEKKGATMNPNYTGRDLRLLQQDYQENDEGHSDDPLGSFIHRHSVRLGFRQPDHVLYNNRVEMDGFPGGGRGRGRGGNNNVLPNQTQQRADVDNGGGGGRGRGRGRGRNNNQTPRNQARQRARRVCEDCEAADAEVYCGECQNASGGVGLALCQGCTTILHAGATRRRHVVTDIDQAPKSNKPYTPHAFKAPFSILVALYSGFTSLPPILSMTEDEVKDRAQPLTDTDLQDKQNGRYVGGFECMENTLMQKGFVQREDARNPTYALTHKGQYLAEQLFSFQQIVSRFLATQGVPKIEIPLRLNTTCGRRKICLIIDEQERDRERLLRLAAERNIDAQVRQLPSGDYIWILTPPLTDTRQKYTQKIPEEELVLPYIVERKTWEDLQDSIRTKRFDKQVNNMMESGLKNLFYLMEGSTACVKYKMTEEQRTKLKGSVEKLMLQNGFYVNYTASWFKSALWLVWMTSLITYTFSQGKLAEDCVPYLEYRRRTSRHAVGTVVMPTDTRKRQSVVWSADRFTGLILRETSYKGEVIQELKYDMNQKNPDYVKSVLIVQNLETYNKRRQTTLNKCLEDVFGDQDRMAGSLISGIIDNMSLACLFQMGVEQKLSPYLSNMLHYDIMSYWQLRIQVLANVYVVRTENDNETLRIQHEMEERGDFGKRLGAQNHALLEGDGHRGKGKGKGQRGKGKALNISGNHHTDETDGTDQAVFASDSQTEEFMVQQAIARSMQDTGTNGYSDESDEETRPHCSHTRIPPRHQGGIIDQGSTRGGQDSYTDDLGQAKTSFPGRGQQLGYNLASDDRMVKKNDDIMDKISTSSPYGKARGAVNIDVLNEDEQLRLAIENSLEEAERQKVENRLPYLCGKLQVKCAATISPDWKASSRSEGIGSASHTHLAANDESGASKQQEFLGKGKTQSNAMSRSRDIVETTHSTSPERIERTMSSLQDKVRTTRSRSQGKVQNGNQEESSHIQIENAHNHTGNLMAGDSQDEELQKVLLLSKQEYEEAMTTTNTYSPSESAAEPVILIDSQEFDGPDLQQVDGCSSPEMETGPVCGDSGESPVILIDSQDSQGQATMTNEGDSNLNGSLVNSTVKHCFDKRREGKCKNFFADSSPSSKSSACRYGDEVDGGIGSPDECDVSCNDSNGGLKVISASAIVDSLMESLVALNDATLPGSSVHTERKPSCTDDENETHCDEEVMNRSSTKITKDESVYEELTHKDLKSRSYPQAKEQEAINENCPTGKEKLFPFDDSPTIAGSPFDDSQTLADAPFEDSQTLANAPFDDSQTLADAPFDDSQTLADAPFDDSQTLADDIPTVNDICRDRIENGLESCGDSNEQTNETTSEVKGEGALRSQGRDICETLPHKVSTELCDQSRRSLFTGDTLDENPTDISNILVQDTQADDLEDRREEIEDDDIDVIPPSPEKDCDKSLSFSTGLLHGSPAISGLNLLTKGSHGERKKEQYQSTCNIARNETSKEPASSTAKLSPISVKYPSGKNLEKRTKSAILDTSMSRCGDIVIGKSDMCDTSKSSLCERDKYMEDSKSVSCSPKSPITSHDSPDINSNCQEDDDETNDESQDLLCNVRALPPLYPSSPNDRPSFSPDLVTSHNSSLSSSPHRSPTGNKDPQQQSFLSESPPLSPKSPSPPPCNFSTLVDKDTPVRDPSPPCSPSSLPDLSPPPCQTLSPSQSSEDIHRLLPASPGSRTYRYISSSNKSSPKSHSLSHTTSTIKSLSEATSLHLSNFTGPGSPRNQTTPRRVTTKISSRSPKASHEYSPPKQNSKVPHSPAKRLCTSTVSNTETNNSVKKSPKVCVSNSSSIIKSSNKVRGFTPNNEDKVIAIKQEKMDDFSVPNRGIDKSCSTIENNGPKPLQHSEAEADDAEVARKLQELFDKEYEMTMSQKKNAEKRQTRRSGQVIKNQNDQRERSSVKSTEEIDTTNDHVIAQQLQQEILMGDNSTGQSTHKVNKHKEERDRLYAEELQRLESKKENTGKLNSRGNSEERDRLLARHLQEEENTIRKEDTMLKEDEALARQLSEMDKQPMPVVSRTVQKRHSDSSPSLSSPKQARTDSPYGGSPARTTPGLGGTTCGAGTRATTSGATAAFERVWHRKLFAMEKRARHASSEQLSAIRKEQNERYQSGKSRGLVGGNHSNASHTASSPWQRAFSASSGNDKSQYIGLDDEGYITSSPSRQPNSVLSPSHRTSSHLNAYNTPSSTLSSSSGRSSGFEDLKSSQMSSSVLSTQSSSSNWGDHASTQRTWNDPHSSQMSPSVSSTQSSSSFNITCGNCGEKGHNRNSKTCSRYYSLEETQHRQAKQEKARQRTEEKVAQERQTREQLANHQMVLEDIALRIQQEKDGLSSTIKRMDKKTKQRDKRKK